MQERVNLNKRIIQDAIECPRFGCYELRKHGEDRDGRGAGPSVLLQLVYGRIIGELAREEFPGGVLVDEKSFAAASLRTDQLLSEGAPLLFEGAFSNEQVRARIDLLIREEGDRWRVWEVKAGTEVKEEYLLDLAVQIHVLESLGMKTTCGLLLVDRTATAKSGSILKRVDCDREIRERLPLIRETIDRLRECDGENLPAAPLERRCRDCVWRCECWPDLPSSSVLDLYQGDGGWREVESLIVAGRMDLADLPPGTALTGIQRRQVEAVVTDSPVISGEMRRLLTGQVRHPIHFLDFEAARPPVPGLPGQHPYDLIPFQWSCHIEQTLGGDLDHHEFLSVDRGDPRRAMTEALLRSIRSEGSIVVYSSFEQEVLRSMASRFPDLAADLASLEARLFDLLPFLRTHYYHPSFNGSFSIKNVLPVFVPGAGYGGMDISDGMEAVWAYHRLNHEDLGDEERRRLIESLLDYCRQDSLAMFQIYRALLRETS